MFLSDEFKVPKSVSVIGAGPGGLFAAEILSAIGYSVRVVDHMPSVARKFLLAGRGGLNLTHSEPLDAFLKRYHPQEPLLLESIRQFPPSALRHWCHELGEPTFVGSSGRVFPKSFKASPLLRAWLRRLDAQGVSFQLGWSCTGFSSSGHLQIASKEAPHENIVLESDAVLLALGGGSWARLGSTGAWVNWMNQEGVSCAPLAPTNCGFEAPLSEDFVSRFAGAPLKKIGLTHETTRLVGEIMIDRSGLEGGGIYALARQLRQAIERDGNTTLWLDLKPDLSKEAIVNRLQRPRGKQSRSTYLRKVLKLSPLALALMREAGTVADEPTALAHQIKCLPLLLTAPRPIERAISSAGGLAFTEIDEHFMLRKKAGVFVCGEMLDWEAPTGGYLLQGVFASANAAARGIHHFLSNERT